MNFEHFTDWLSERLKEPLPGLDAHLEMAPKFRILQIKEYMNVENAKKSGVLVLLFPENDRIKTVVIVRPRYQGVHSGQVSFPGGKFEDADVEMINTAFRETSEEIGVNVDKANRIGELSMLYIPPSNFLVQPVVAFLDARPEYRPDKKEVAGIEEIFLDELFSENAVSEKEIIINEFMKTKVPCFKIKDTVIWGATAMIINELKKICSQYVVSETV